MAYSLYLNPTMTFGLASKLGTKNIFLGYCSEKTINDISSYWDELGFVYYWNSYQEDTNIAQLATKIAELMEFEHPNHILVEQE